MSAPCTNPYTSEGTCDDLVQMYFCRLTDGLFSLAGVPKCLEFGILRTLGMIRSEHPALGLLLRLMVELNGYLYVCV